MPKTKTIPPLRTNIKVSLLPDVELTDKELENLVGEISKLLSKSTKCSSIAVTTSKENEDDFVSKVWRWIHENGKGRNKDAVKWVKSECQYLSSKAEMSDGEKEEKFFDHASQYIVDVREDHLDCPDMCACAHALDEIRDELAEELGVEDY